MAYYERPADMCALSIYDRDATLGMMEAIATRTKMILSKANLNKDPVLRINTDPEGFVPIKMIADLHQIKVIKEEEDFVLKALEKSQAFEVRDKKKVRLVRSPRPSQEQVPSVSRTVEANFVNVPPRT